jgi:hypothetical protein
LTWYSVAAGVCAPTVVIANTPTEIADIKMRVIAK